jgi:hypothetical protein
MASNPLNIGFTRTLNGNKWDRWTHLLHRLILVQLTDSDDTFKWKYIWKMKVPLKVKNFHVVSSQESDPHER